MGDAAPPMFEDRAIPSISALDISLSAGRLRRMGCNRCQLERIPVADS
jgi:hypothetical protein